MDRRLTYVINVGKPQFQKHEKSHTGGIPCEYEECGKAYKCFTDSEYMKQLSYWMLYEVKQCRKRIRIFYNPCWNDIVKL